MDVPHKNKSRIYEHVAMYLWTIWDMLIFWVFGRSL
jgi:hypothetical protein